jgi:serine/threonine protein phosphatase PrpC
MRSADDQFIMLACDGIWDSISNEECVKQLQPSSPLQATKEALCKPVENLFDLIIAPTKSGKIGHDNMTAILIYLN